MFETSNDRFVKPYAAFFDRFCAISWLGTIYCIVSADSSDTLSIEFSTSSVSVLDHTYVHYTTCTCR